MELPSIEHVTGPVTGVEPLFDYDYRAAWKVSVDGGQFLVKADSRPGSAEREREAHRHIEVGGIPVQPLAGTLDDPPTLVFRWLDDVTPLSESPSVAGAREAGAVLRQLHELPVLRPRTEGWATHIERWFEDELAKMLDGKAIAAREAREALRRQRQFRQVLAETSLAWIHGDCQAAHFLMEEVTGRVAALIDWGDAQHGAPEADFTVLSLFHPELLEPALDGYEATPEFRSRLAHTLPLYRAVRAAGAYHWLETHGYKGETWTVEAVRRFVA